jgi:hypothetical protein
MFDRLIVSRTEPAPSASEGRWLAPSLALGAGLLLMLSPAARWAIGRPIPPEERVGPMEPYQLAARLAEQEPSSGRRVLALPFWWGDYLLWCLPAGDQLFCYCRPESLTRSKADVPEGDPTPAEWNALVERYHFDTLVVRAESSENLRAFREQRPNEWDVIETPDGRGLAAVRRNNP